MLELVNNVVKLPVKKQKPPVRYPDTFLASEGNNHFKLITENPWPCSPYLNDRADINYRLHKVLAGTPLTAQLILRELFSMARAKGKLELKLFVNPCSKNIGAPSFCEIAGIGYYETFATNFKTVGITYRSWTEYHTTEGDRFQGKMVLRVNGLGGRKTTFRLNHNLIVALAKSMHLSPSKVNGKDVSKTLLLPLTSKIDFS